MGGGIAHAFLLSGSAVTVIESDDASASAARERIVSALAKAGQLDGTQQLAVATTPDALASCALVVEAVPEDLALKQRILAGIEQIAPTAWIASNTSSMSIGRLASGLARPERVIGLHFFNPVPVSELVEVVVGPATSDELIANARSWVAGLGKEAIVVQDSPGFASSRLGLALALEAMRMLEQGVAAAADIDKAMTAGYKHRAGPLLTTDIVGLDVRLAIAEHLARELGNRFDPPDILREKVVAGHLGRKAGQGFYCWD